MAMSPVTSFYCFYSLHVFTIEVQDKFLKRSSFEYIAITKGICLSILLEGII